MLDESIAEANNIFREWQGFQGKVLQYDGSPGISGKLEILFSSGQDRYFLLNCSSCFREFETRFCWSVDRLKIELDPSSRHLHIFDSVAQLNINTAKLQIYELLNTVEVARMESGLSIDVEYPLFENTTTLPELFHNLTSDITIDNIRTYIGGFYACTDILCIRLHFDNTVTQESKYGKNIRGIIRDTFEINLQPRTKKIVEHEMIFILLHKPRYLYSLNNPILDPSRIDIRKNPNGMSILSDLNGQVLRVECNDSEWTDWVRYYNYFEFARQQSEWFAGDGVEALYLKWAARKQTQILSINTSTDRLKI